jgi:D-3-phosphoglycerate dehydrogenase / 2-oxoglutarate reductase
LYRIWCERPMPSVYLPMLESFAECASPENLNSIQDSLVGTHAIIAGAGIRYDGGFIDQLPTLKVISRTGIGVDNIVIADATTRGVAICNTPDAPTASTAELTITLMLAAAKQLKRFEYGLIHGERRNFFNEYQGVELAGLRLGLVGLGRIGGRVAKVAQALDMTVVGYDPYVPAGRAAELGIEGAPDLESLLRTSDVVSLHIPATTETRGLMNAERFAMMKRGSFIINAARGSLIDEAALLDALERGHLAGAGLDVYEPEPPDPKNPLLYRDDVVCMPHVGGTTVASKDRLWREALAQALQVLRGERPPNLVNPEVWEKRRQ